MALAAGSGGGGGSGLTGVSRPLDELPIKNAKAVRNCTQLFMGGRGVRVLAHFEAFGNLEVLWLNGNRIRDVQHLDCLPRLKELYLHNNLIQSLANCKLAYRFVEVLSLAHNQLQDLDATLLALSRLGRLRVLSLEGNPITQELRYRRAAIAALPSLRVLDSHEVTAEERREAMVWLRDSRHRSTAAAAPPPLSARGPASPSQSCWPQSLTRPRSSAPVAFGSRAPPPAASSYDHAAVFAELRRRVLAIRAARASEEQRRVRQALSAPASASLSPAAPPTLSWGGEDAQRQRVQQRRRKALEQHVEAALSARGVDAVSPRSAAAIAASLPMPSQPDDAELRAALERRDEQPVTAAALVDVALQCRWRRAPATRRRALADSQYAEARAALQRGEREALAASLDRALSLDFDETEEHSETKHEGKLDGGAATKQREWRRPAGAPVDEFSFFAYADVTPVAIELLQREDKSRPWRVVSGARRSVPKRSVPV
jgi:hypothetical protein